MNLERRVAVAAFIVAVALAAAVFVARQSECVPSDDSEPARVPKNRTRLEVQVADRPYSPPSAAVRKKFDGEWKARAGRVDLEALLLDGVGDCTLTSKGQKTEWAIEITEYWGDDLFDLGVWSRDDVSLWTASFEADDEIRVWRIVWELKGIPKAPFVLRRVRAASR